MSSYLIGSLALLAAWGSGGQTTDTQGALRSLLARPFGEVWVGLTALGLVCYAVWRFIQSIGDADRHGSDGKGLAIRTGLFVSGIANLALAYFALGLAFPGIVPGGGSGSGDGSTQDWTASLMSQPFGRWLVALLGLIVIGVGIAHFYRTFERQLDFRGRGGWMCRVSQFGLAARGVVFLVIGGFLVLAAWQADPSQARGLGGALRTLQSQSYGGALLGIVALGLVAFAVYSFIEARYRRIRT